MLTFVLDNLAAIGLGIGFVSALTLAFSLAPLLRSLKFVTECLALSMETVVGQGDVVQFTGIDRNLERASRRAWQRMLAGSILLAASFACQGAALYVHRATTPPQANSHPPAQSSSPTQHNCHTNSAATKTPH